MRWSNYVNCMAKDVCQNILTIFHLTHNNYVTMSVVGMATAQTSLAAGNDVPGQSVCWVSIWPTFGCSNFYCVSWWPKVDTVNPWSIPRMLDCYITVGAPMTDGSYLQLHTLYSTRMSLENTNKFMHGTSYRGFNPLCSHMHRLRAM